MELLLEAERRCLHSSLALLTCLVGTCLGLSSNLAKIVKHASWPELDPELKTVRKLIHVLQTVLAGMTSWRPVTYMFYRRYPKHIFRYMT